MIVSFVSLSSVFLLWLFFGAFGSDGSGLGLFFVFVLFVCFLRADISNKIKEQSGLSVKTTASSGKSTTEEKYILSQASE